MLGIGIPCRLNLCHRLVGVDVAGTGAILQLGECIFDAAVLRVRARREAG